MNRWPNASRKEQKKVKPVHPIEKKLIDVETLLELLQDAVDQFQRTRDALDCEAGYPAKSRWLVRRPAPYEDPGLN